MIPNSTYSNQCSLNGVYLPPILSSKFLVKKIQSIKKKFVSLKSFQNFLKAHGNFFEAFDYTEKLLNIKIQNDMNIFNEATYNICSMTYTQVINNFNLDI